VGRRGEGPKEYGYAGRIVPIPGDSSLMHDGRNVRYLYIGPDVKPGETFRLPDNIWVKIGGRGSVPRASDSRGNLFFESSPVTVIRGGQPNFPLDSTAVTRYDRRAMRLDTIAFVQLDKANVVVQALARGTSTRFGALAFPTRDDWTVMPDGGLAVVRAADYHIDRYAPTGTKTSGPAVRTTPVVVDEAEKEAWRAERRGTMVTRSDGPSVPTNPREPEWQKVKPPFVYWSSIARSNGEIWVLRSHRASAAPIYDVFSPALVLVRRVELPLRSRLLGFGIGTAYLVVRDEDDLEHLRRYKLP
jgi:hypothetical protein